MSEVKTRTNADAIREIIEKLRVAALARGEKVEPQALETFEFLLGGGDDTTQEHRFAVVMSTVAVLLVMRPDLEKILELARVRVAKNLIDALVTKLANKKEEEVQV